MINKKIRFGIFLLIGVLFMLSFCSAYMRSDPKYTQIDSSGDFGSFDKSMCDAGQDFIIQISPFGCTPAVVRSDLLEEQNVPVFCRLGATKINPLIDVEAIEGISFSGKYPEEVSGIGFHPAKAALGVSGDLNSPVLNNIGYAVIVLKKQKNASAMPEFVEGNLTANIKYDIKNAFGIGTASFYLSEMSDQEWEDKYVQYGFWDGRGYLRAEGIDNEEATISIYDDTKKISSVNLKKGKISEKIYLPGFDCLAGLQLKLDGLEAPDTRAKLRVNADVIEVAEGEKFLENRCRVTNIDMQGLVQRVSINCKEDEGGKNFDLKLSPKIKLKINGEEREAGIGDWLYQDSEKSVYLGFIGSKEGSNKKEDLFLYLVAMPQHKDRLDEEEISSIATLVSQLTYSRLTGTGSVDFVGNVLKVYSGAANLVYKFLKEGKSFYRLNYNEGLENVFGGEVSIRGFAEPQDGNLEDDKEYYKNAMKDYETILDSFSNEKYSNEDKITFGESALFEKIKLANDVGQKKSMIELCKEFKEKYPNSKKNLREYCENEYKLSNSETANRPISINGNVKQISFDGIYEPSEKEYSAEIKVKDPNGKLFTFTLRKNKILYLNDSQNEFVQLVSIDDDSAMIKVNLLPEGKIDAVTKFLLVSDTKKLKKDVAESFGSGYIFTLTKVNLKKTAKVSVIPSIDNAGTEANFSFKIGIEQRAIELSPEKTRKKIKELNETIKEWEERSESLGSVVKGLKTACLGTGALLTVKNFFANIGGKAIARQNIMRGDGGWYERCTDYVSEGKYYSQEECMVEESSNIEKDVDSWYEVMTEQNERMKKLQEGITETSAFGERVVDDEKFIKKYAPDVQEYLEDNFGDEFENPDNPSEFINMNEMKTTLSYDSWKNSGNYDKEQLRNIELYATILKSNPDDVMAKKRLYSELLDVKINSENYAERSNWASDLGISSNQIGFLETGKNAKQLPYDGLENKDLKKKITEINDNSKIKVLQTSQGKKYIIVLDDSSGTDTLPIKEVYDSDGILVKKPSELENVYFKKYDQTSYQNEFKSSVGDVVPVVKYYETEPYKGLPAIVPFDLKNGWYVATKQTLPIMGNIKAFDDSGRVSSFWLCNVGKNGREEFNSGNDICQMINTGTGQPYNQFSGLEEGEAVKRIKAGVKAIEQASKQYKSGVQRVNINVGYGNLNLKVGNPAVDIPDMQCQDFMSPKECQLLFNVCDPVICPSSRCDFGGAYPVKDVIQSGIIGSLALCLPNFREGIYIPVCLTGIKAGIDGLLSVYSSYRDCLQESLDTGAMVGICDEIYSIHLCEFFWKQALPLADVIIPKMMEVLLGQNVHGGGEYLGVASAWSNAGKSIEYFTQYYAANSFKAFKARSTEEVGGEVCKSFISGVYPEGGNLFDSLTEPDSPSQFHGRFDEIPFTSTTVPPISQYKVFYHIFAGKDSGAYYQVYLKGDAGSSFYQDNSNRRIVASGYIATGGYATETKDFTAPSGYQELCITVNNQEECGFKQVSTSFAVNYVKDQYMASQTEDIDVKTEKECISGTASVYSLLTPNLQSSAEEIIDPAIYRRGIIRICATDDPGKGTDPYSGTENSRWKEVGYCDNQKIKCWIDGESVENAIRTTTIEEEALDTITKNQMKILMNEGDYVEDFGGLLKEIGKLDNQKKISKINEFFEKVFFNNQKANLLLLRGNAYGELARGLYKEIKVVGTTTTSTGGTAFSGISGDYSSFVFEFQDGTPARNIFYRYYNGKWEWSANEGGRWVEAPEVDEGRFTDSPLVNYELLEKSKEFVKTLDGVSFEKGLGLLIDRTFRNKEGFGSFGSTGLVTETVSLTSKGVFSVKQKEGDLNFQYKDNKWEVSGYIKDNDKLISSLENKDLFEGAVLIFTMEGGEPTQSGTGKSEDSNDGCDDSIERCKIWKTAKKFVEEGHDTERVLSGGEIDKSYVCARFTTEVLISTNIGGFELPPEGYCPLDSVKSMLKILSKRNDFVEIQGTKNFEKGDLVAFKWDESRQHMTIFDYYDGDNILHLYVLGEGGRNSPAVQQDYILGIDGEILGAYRYIGGDPGLSRTKWTIDSALEKIKILRGKYSDNKVFVDQIYEDGILTDEEYIEINGEGLFNLEEDMSWVKKLLLEKKI